MLTQAVYPIETINHSDNAFLRVNQDACIALPLRISEPFKLIKNMHKRIIVKHDDSIDTIQPKLQEKIPSSQSGYQPSDSTNLEIMFNNTPCKYGKAEK